MLSLKAVDRDSVESNQRL